MKPSTVKKLYLLCSVKECLLYINLMLTSDTISLRFYQYELKFL